MPRIYPLFSSSKGNCTYIGTPESGVLIDCGASCRKICNALELNSHQEIADLFVMTPYAHKTGPSDAARLNALERLSVGAEFILRIYRNE